MSHRPVLAMPLRRAVAAVATLAIAALATVITSPMARAAEPGVTSADGFLTASIGSVSLSTDLDGNGRPDAGDTVSAVVTLTANGKNVDITSIPTSLVNWNFKSHTINAGDTWTTTINRTVLATDIGYMAGVTFADATVNYRTWSTVQLGPFPVPVAVSGSMTVPWPGAIFTPPTPLTAVTTMDVTENVSTADGAVAEGDTVGYTTTFTNTSGLVLRLTSLPGYDDFTSEVVLAPGGTATFHHTPVTVTYADMVAGSISFPGATASWRAGYFDYTLLWNGTTPLSYSSVATEAINDSFTADVTTEVHQGSTDTVAPLGTAVAGDEIDYRFNVTNTGNVTHNYVYLYNWLGSGAGRITDASLTPGGTLPNGIYGDFYLRSQDGVFAPHVLTDADIDLGYVDLSWTAVAAPTEAVYLADSAAHTVTITKRVYLRDFDTKARLTFTDATLNDTNGDGIGQAGETIDYRVRFKNNADQALLIDAAGELAGSDLTAPLGAKFNGRMLAREEVVAKQWEYTITPADEARGTVDLGVVVSYTGQADWASDSREVWAPQIETGPYVAPSTTFVADSTFVDDNGDGFPSIGETVTFSVTVTNTGAYDLTNLVVSDGTPADVTGLLPAFSSTIAAGAFETQTFDYVITQADYARGTIGYTASMVADGMGDTLSNTELVVAISFAAYDTDLGTEGGIVVCFNGSDTSTVTIGSQIQVMPDSCAFAGDPLGSRVVGFSTPVTMGVDTYTVTVPGRMGVGTHRIALYGADGALVGFKTVQLVDPIGFAADEETLAFTGTDNEQLGYIAGGGAALMLLGSAMLFGSSRLRRREA